MWHFRFFGTILAVLALLGSMESQTALAAYPASSEFSMSQPQETRGLDGSFQLVVMGNNAIPLDISVGKFPPKAQSEKPAVEKPKASPKASKQKKKKVKTANVKKAPAKKPVVVEEEKGFLTRALKTLVGDGDDKKNPASMSLLQKTAGKKSEPNKKEEGLLTKTLKTLMGGDGDKRDATSKSQPQKTAGKKSEPDKKEEGLLTETLKMLMGGDKKKEQTAKKNVLNPIGMVPGSTTKNKTKEQPKTAKSETKATLKDSFEKLIGVGNVKDDGNAQSGKNKEFAGPLGGGNQKNPSKLVKAEDTVPKPRGLTARQYIEDEEEQLEKDRGGVKKGKNVLKESFKTLFSDDKKKEGGK